MLEKIYDLRDPDWVPPHLREPELPGPVVLTDPGPCPAGTPPEVWAKFTELLTNGIFEQVRENGQVYVRPGPRFAEYGAPAETPKVGKPAIYDFAGLEVGGEFVVLDGPGRAKWESFRTYVARRAKELGFKLKAHRNENNSYVVKREA